ncbi:MAG: hypothetical protein QXR13_00860 [Candidatus Bathyarchaeia archaeon]
MGRKPAERGPILLIFMERIIGFVLLIIGATLLYNTYINWATLGEITSYFFTIVSALLLLTGLIMLISKQNKL